MKNNSCASQDKLSKSWAVNKFKCPNEDCELLNPLYIGQTRNTIKRQLEQHQKDGAIKEHMEKKHNTSIQTQDLENNTLPVKSFKILSVWQYMKPFSSSNKDPTSTDKKIISLILLNFTPEVHMQPTLPPRLHIKLQPAQIQP